MLNKLDAARLQINNRKIQQIVEMEEDDALMAEMQKLKGLIQIDQQFLVSMVMTNLKSWKDIWRNVRQVYD